MIPIPIKYNKDIHMREVITKPLNQKDLVFINSVLESITKDNAEPYIVKYGNDRIAICRKGLQPARIEKSKHHHYFALMNSSGKVLVNGKNSRRVESMICILRALFQRNPARQRKLARNSNLSVAERCKLFNYTLVKQGEPFE